MSRSASEWGGTSARQTKCCPLPVLYSNRIAPSWPSRSEATSKVISSAAFSMVRFAAPWTMSASVSDVVRVAVTS